MTEEIMQIIRQRRGLKPNDTPKDGAIEVTSPFGKLRDIFGWEFGDPGWAETFLEWAEECGYEIKEKGR